MPRPRIEGMDDRIIASFVSRKIYASSKDVIHAALKALLREQMQRESAERMNGPSFSDETYSMQLEAEKGSKRNASMGYMGRKTGSR